MNLYLIEFYVKNPKTGETGWDINFAWVWANDEVQAHEKLVANHGGRFECVIQIEQYAEIVPLGGPFRVNTPDANLFIIP